MKKETYNLINSILEGLFIITLALIVLIGLIYVPINYAFNLELSKKCLDNNKTYFEFKTLDGFPISGKYCGDLNELKELIEEAKEIN